MSDSYLWYATLNKPTWAPPSWLFGPVWFVLYILIFISYGFVFIKVLKGKLPKSLLLPFLLNMFFNFIFTFIQFGLKNNLLAALDISLVLVTLIVAIKIIYRYYPWVSYINIPYLLWVMFATILQFTITYLNTRV